MCTPLTDAAVHTLFTRITALHTLPIRDRHELLTDQILDFLREYPHHKLMIHDPYIDSNH